MAATSVTSKQNSRTDDVSTGSSNSKGSKSSKSSSSTRNEIGPGQGQGVGEGGIIRMPTAAVGRPVDADMQVRREEKRRKEKGEKIKKCKCKWSAVVGTIVLSEKSENYRGRVGERNGR